MSIALLWDASYLWGLLIVHAMRELGVDVHPVKAKDIAQESFSDKFSLLLVPGGSARAKYQALGNEGCDAIRTFVRHGGNYMGFCGGAGLALADKSTGGLGLCPWQRERFADRLQHLLSGPMQVTFTTAETPLLPVDRSNACLPVWWPGRFAPAAGNDDVEVLARYVAPAHGAFMADLALDKLPADVLEDWASVYGITINPSLYHAPCVINGLYGKGRYFLSYSHLETPESPAANAWLAHVLRQLGAVTPRHIAVPAWAHNVTVCWNDPTLIHCCQAMEELIQLGIDHGLLFFRSTWLIGWRAGVPGSGLNNLRLALRTLIALPPTPKVQHLWHDKAPDFAMRFAVFLRGAKACLLAQRLAATVPDAVPRDQLDNRRAALFGTAMHGGGLYQELLNDLDDLLFHAIAAQRGQA